MQVTRHITLKTIFGVNEHNKMINVRNLVVDDLSSYNIIIRHPAFNFLKAFLSTLYLCMIYLLPNRHMGIIQGNHAISRICYQDILRLKNTMMAVIQAQWTET